VEVWILRHIEWVALGGLLLLAVAGILVWKWREIHQRVGIWGRVGTVLGWCLIGVGLLGGLVPIIPGFPAGILGLLLLGPEDPGIRWIWSRLHRIALRLSERQVPWQGRLGTRLLRLEARIIEKVYQEGQKLPWEPLEGPGA